MNNLDEMYRKTLEVEAKMLNTPDHCTINRAMELIASAYQLGKQESDKQELRERYAGLAMQAIISDHEAMNKIQIALEKRGYQYINNSAVVVAELAVSYANTLIEQLRKEE